MVVRHGRQKAGNLHRSEPSKIFLGRPRPNDHVKASVTISTFPKI